MSRPASDFVLAQEKYLEALERALGSAREAVEHMQSCRHCRIFGKCHDAGLLTGQMYLNIKEANVLKQEMEVLQTRGAERAYDLVRHISENEDSQYYEIAQLIIADEKGEADGSGIK